MNQWDGRKGPLVVAFVFTAFVIAVIISQVL